MQANKAKRAINGNLPTRLLYKQLTNTPHSHHTAPCATEAPDRHRGTAPTAGARGTRATHIQLKPRRRGNPLAPMRKPRHGSAVDQRWAITNKTDGN